MANTLAELVVISVPAVGHLMSTIEMAKLLVNRDKRLSITVLVINPLPDSGSGSTLTTYMESLTKNAIERITFVQLPQPQIPPNPDPKARFAFFVEFLKAHRKYVKNVVSDLISQRGSGCIAGFVVDMFCAGMMDVASEFNIPTYVYLTSNAVLLGFMVYIQTLYDEQNKDVIELSKSDMEVSVPSLVKPVPTTVFPSGIETKDGLDLFIMSARNTRQAKAIIVNTFLELETHAIESLSSDSSIPPVYPVGPVLNLDGAAGKNSDGDIISWLDRQPPSSVVFLCFGSRGSFEEVQVKEIALALERSGHRFLWSLRRPPPPESRVPEDYEDPGEVLPEGFLERTAGIGKVIGWAPQMAVLGHGAVGGFVSHCGWNSTLESLWFGVPAATWPMYAEQQLNAFEMVVELGLAVEIKLDYEKDMGNTVIVTAEEIEGGIRRLMEDKEVRAKVKEMAGKCRSAVTDGGSSYASVGRLVQDFLSNMS